MKNSMKLVISDSEVSMVQMALAKEHHDRKGVFQNLQAQGHVKILNTEDPARIHVQIEDETFYDERSRFPSVVLMAKLQLAIAAGRSCRNISWSIDGGGTFNDPALSYAINAGTIYHQVVQYEQAEARIHRPVGKSAILGMGYGRDWDARKSTVKRVTAAVKQKFAKGLRP